MAKQRMVNTRFWIDSYVSTLDPIERLVFLYLLTNSNTNICGIYEIPIRRIAFDIGIDTQVAQTIMGRLERDGKIMYRDGWVAIKNFIKHQAINPKVQAGINYELADKPIELVKFIDIHLSTPKDRIKRKKIPKTLKDKILDKCEHKCVECGESETIKLEIDHITPLILGGTNDFENLQILCRTCNGKKNSQLRWNKNGDVEYSVPNKMGGLSHSNTNSNSNLNTNTNSKKEMSTSMFEDFWKQYPKKTSKKLSFDLWKKYKLDSEINNILSFIEKAKETDRWKKGFVKNPETFIRQETWKDDINAYNDIKKETDIIKI
jgi:hypothetical protein